MGITDITILLLGAVAGSFAGVIAERIYTGQSWAQGRSRCNACKRMLTAVDMIPVFSWLMSLGKCRTCGASITATYALLEALLGFCFWAAYVCIGLTPALLPFLLALVILLALVLYDLRHMVVPPALSTLFIGAAGAYAVLANDIHTLGLVLMYAGTIALILFLFFALSRGRLMGLGDTPVAFGLSLLAGQFAFAGFVFSFWVGAVVGILLLFLRRRTTKMNTEVPFVPFLAVGFLLAFFTQWNPFALLLW